MSKHTDTLQSLGANGLLSDTDNLQSEVVYKLRIDFDLLRKQVEWLESHTNPEDTDIVNGLLGLLDEIKDQAALELGEETVFGVLRGN